MDATIKTFLLLSRALRVDGDNDADAELGAAISDASVDWKRLIELADQERMTAALASTLRRRKLLEALPRTVQGAFRRRYLMATEVNTRIKRQAEQAIRILNAADITPMLLKGGLHLFEAEPDELCERRMADLDIVVPADRLEDSIQALRDANYIPDKEDEDWTYHYRPMYHPDHIVGLELHIRPGEQREFLTVEEAWQKAVPVDAPGLKIVALEPGHRIAHNIFHSEVQDRGFTLGLVCLRQLYDLAKICARFEGKIDWPEIFERMERNDMGALFRARMHLAVELLGAPPPPIAVDGARSRRYLKRCLTQLRWQHLMNGARWFAGLAGPVNRYHLDLLYSCGTTGLNMHMHRAKHIWKIFWRHRGHIGERDGSVQAAHFVDV